MRKLLTAALQHNFRAGMVIELLKNGNCHIDFSATRQGRIVHPPG